MKATQYQARVFNKNGEEYTKITIGLKCNKSMLENMIIALGGQMIKCTRMAKHYEIKGNKMRLMVVC
ncbi:hypothetical protein NZ45_00860 [Clostridium botulinum]|uniref:Transposase n=1 Tax=Clostridium botulinum TaxID=1491 RepID=A0ABD7CFQ2_CLOBO|nr:hypothetical protein [Clostridium botulinum]KGO15587.1 hypothetical protein NZ45_00860 [Clostridium botulinum]QRI51986.1 hypothetical protein JQS73_11015 [Clostridium botulinum]